MNTKTLAAALAVAAGALHASEYYSNITNDWFTGMQTNVYNEGMARLATNANDIAGLLMVGSWHFDFGDPAVASNAMERIVEVGRTITTENFTNRVWLLELDNRSVFRRLGEETDEMRAEDRAKASATGLLPHYWRELDALDCDGWFGEARTPDNSY